MKKIVRDNIKTIVAFFLGIIVCGGSVYAATLISSSEVTYRSSNVQAALDELYDKIYAKCDYDIGKVWEFGFTNSFQNFEVPCEGTYTIELWGAQGGGNTDKGLGGYTKGTISLDKSEKLYIYVGNKPGLTDNNYNGGGDTNNTVYPSYDGGGATDVRYFSETPSNADLAWNSFNGLKSRIMVAGGGGGYEGYARRQGQAAGGLVGYDAEGGATGGTQTSGGSRGTAGSGGENGAFGIGGNGEFSYGGGAGGGGYYGGGGNGNSYTVWAGAGGSSFISGHNGCNAISGNSTQDNIIHTGISTHFSDKAFTETVMIDGEGYAWTTEKGATSTGMPTHDGTSTMKGNTGNGYAKITLVGLN